MSDAATYHLVCRNCEKEALVETAPKAEQQASDHEAITGHRLDFKKVD